jgi:tetratricopeptide (TPR) repeat protein
MAHNNLGNRLFDLERYEEAEAAYRKAIELDPNYASPHNGLGSLLRRLKRYEEAEAAYRKAIELDPNYAMARNNQGSLLSDLERYEEAEVAYRKAIELDPNLVMAHNNLGSLLSVLERYEEAEVAYRKAIELDPNYAMAHNHLGDLLAVLERYEEAEAACAKAIELNPEYADACVDQGRILYLQNKISQCIEAFEKAIEIEPDNPTAHNNLGFVLGGQGENYDESIRELTHALELGHTPSITYNNLGYIFLRRKEYARAEDSLEDALEEGQGETVILRVAFYQNTYVLIDEDPFPKEFLGEEAVAYCNLATVFAEQGHMDLALEMGKEAIDSCPESPLGYRAIGHIYLETDDFNRALEAFNKALELDSENEEIHKLVEFAKSKASE